MSESFKNESPRSQLPIYLVGFLVAACVVWMLWLPETVSGRVMLPHGDHLIQYRWWLQFDMALREGVWSPKWAHVAHGGLGEPTFLYYQPLFFYITSAFGWLMSPAGAIRAAIWFPYTLLGAIAFARIQAFTTLPRAVAAVIFIVTCPALFFLSTHTGAFPWVMAMPLCMLLALESCRDKPDFGKVAVWVCLVCLTHLLSGLMSLMCVGVSRLLFSFPSRRTLQGHLQWVGGIILGLSLAAFFLYPAISQQGYINPSGWTSDASLDWHRGFAFPIFSYFKYGPRWFLWQWPIPAFTLALCGLVFWITKGGERSAAVARQNLLACRLATIALVGLIFSSEIAYPLFAVLPPLQKLQFPYRFVFPAMLLATFALCIVCAACWPEIKSRRWVKYSCVLVVCAQGLIVVLLHYNIVGFGKPMPDFRSVLQGKFGQIEYLTSNRSVNSDKYTDDGGLAAECSRLAAVCHIDATHSHALVVSIASEHGVSVRLPLFSFPGWRVSVDGANQKVTSDLATGLLLVRVTSGTHVIAVRWGGTPAEPIASLVSMVAAAYLFIIFLARAFSGGARRNCLPSTGSG